MWISEGRLDARKKGGAWILLGLQDKPKPKTRGKAIRGQKRLGVVKQFSKQGELIGTYETSAMAGEAVGITRANLAMALNKPTRSAGGFRWEREDLY